MLMNEDEFDSRLKAALIQAAELDYMRNIPPDDEIDISTQFTRRMRRFRQNPRSYVKRINRPVHRRVLRVFAVVLIAISVVLGAAMAIPSTRAAIIEFVRSWFADHTEYMIADSAKDSAIDGWMFEYIPAGFILTDERTGELSSSHEYSDEAGNRIKIAISGNTAMPHIDNEHSEFYQIEINGRGADVYESNDMEFPSHIVLYASSENAVIHIQGNVNTTELIKVAENISR